MRNQFLRIFLWLAVTLWGIALGAKIFDLVVLGSAWGLSPPSSFIYLPYGKSFPVDPGLFFQPLSAAILALTVAALACGWKSAARNLLLLAIGSFVVIWIFTPTVFWPMIFQLWEIHRGRLASTEVQAIALVHKWYVWDSFRIVLIGIGFVASVRGLAAITAENRKVT